MFCKNCGTEIKEDEKYCPKCGTKIIKEEVVETDSIDVKESGNHLKKVLVIMVISIILFVVVTFASYTIFNCFLKDNNDMSSSSAVIDDKTESEGEGSDVNQTQTDSTVSSVEETTISVISTEKPAVLSNAYGEYYIGGYRLFSLNNDNSVSQVDVDSSDENNVSYPGIDIHKSVYDGQALFAQDGDTVTELYKFTFSDNDTVEREVWIDEQTLKNSVVVTGKNNNLNKNRYTGNMRDWQLDGDYIYFIYMPGVEYITTEQSIAYRLGRITKDGSNIEFLGDEIASTYAVKDDWIYYYDNGFTYDESKNSKYYYDYSRVGIYKIKSDGSQKQLLLNNFETDENDTRTNIMYCDKMNIFGDYIYFIDYSKNGKSRVCRIKTDGSELEYISGNGAYSYTVDTENDKLYYATGQFGASQIESKTIYEVSISAKTETELFKYGSLGQPEFSYYDNYLYFTNQSYYHPGKNAEEPGVCGMRYDLNNKTMQTLYGYVETTNVYDENGFIDKKVETSNYYWDEATYYSDHY